MLDIVALVVFVGMAYRIVTTVRRESAIFAEFKQSTALGYAALLFPLGPVFMLFFGTRAPLAGIFLCAACYLPGLVLARKATTVFGRAGTDRVRTADSAAWQAFATAVAGLTYAAVVLVLALGVASLHGPTDA